MNYAGRFDATIPSDGQGDAAHSHVHVESVRGHAPADAIVVPDAQLLFHADFKRSGLDLILHKDDHELVLHDYFKGDKHAALASPDGAHLTGDLVDALAGSVEVAQAGGGAVAANQVIGHVTKLAGSATAIRNGVSIILNMGDNVEKGDVVQSGSDSTLGITFIDGTVFGLSSNARMVLNEMVYDPNGTNNSSLLSLVAGTITFVAGETAKHGDMKVDTPVATMGIRGTAVLVEIDFTVPGQGTTPDAKFQVLVEPDGSTGSYILFDKTTLQPLAVVNQAGQQINISNGVISESSAPLSQDVQKLIQDVFTLKFSDNSQTNPKTTTAQTDSTNPLLFGQPIKLASGATATPIFEPVTGGSSSPQTQTQNDQTPGFFRVPGQPTAVVLDSHGSPATSFTLTELAGKTGDATDSDIVGGTVHFTDLNPGDRPTVSISLAHLTLYNSQHQQIADLDAGHLPTNASLQIDDLIAAGINIKVTPAPGNNNNGSVTWTYSLVDKAFDFLGAGESITLTYYVRVDNNYTPADQAATIPITITVTGTNDAPVITTGARTIAFSGGTDTTGGTLKSTNPTHGTLNFTDVDLDDTHTVGAALTSVVMSDGSKVPPGPLTLFEKALTASLATDSTGTGNGVIDWQFAQLPVYEADFIPNGQTLTLTYTVTVTDSQGATSDQTVTVTISGTDEKAVVWIHTTGDGSPDSEWSTAQNWETGTVPTATDDVIIITNQLLGLTPSYPVTIDHKTAAFAHSVTMNDYSGVAPELDNFGSLTISASLTLSADSILHNFGTMTVGGKAEFLDHSVLVNSGTLTLEGGGDFAGSSSITNNKGGTIEVAASAPLNVSVNVTNFGHITVDIDAELTLGAATIDGGTITVDASLIEVFAPQGVKFGPVADSSSVYADDGGTVTVIDSAGYGILELQGSGVLQNGTLDNIGHIDVSGTGNALHDEQVTANSVLEVKSGGTLLIDHGTAIVNDVPGTEILQNGTILPGGGSIIVDDTASLTVNDATITGGLVANEAGGSIALTGLATLQDGWLYNYGQMNVSGVDVLDGEVVSNTGAAAIDITGELTLQDGTSITNGESNAVTVEIDASLALQDGSSIVGGQLINFGAVYLEASTGATFDGVSVNNTYGTIQVDCDFTPPVTLLLDGGTTITGGRLAIGDVGTLEVSTKAGATLSNITVDNSNIVQIDKGSVLALHQAMISGGTVDDVGTIHVTGDSAIDGAALNGGQVNIDTGIALTLDDTTVTGTDFSGAIVLDSEHTLTLDNVGLDGALTNGGSVTIDADHTLTLNDGEIDGGVVINDGTINSTGTSAIDGADVTNNGVIGAISGTLTIDPGTFTNTSTLEADGGELDISGEQFANMGTLGAIGGGTLKLISTEVTDSHGGSVTIGTGSILDLDNSGISGGTLDNTGTLDNLGGDNTIAARVIDHGGTIEVKSGMLDLAGGICGIGTLIIDAGATLEIAGADGQTITYAGGTSTLELDLGSLQFTGTITGQSFTGGNFTLTGAADISSVSGDGIGFNASGGTQDLPAAITLTPSGTITGAANGIKVVQKGVGDVKVDPSGAVTGQAGSGVVVQDSSTGSGNITVDATGPVSGNGHGSDGLLVQNLNASNPGDIDVTAAGDVSGNAYGIDISQSGNGDVTVEADGHVTSNTHYGIRVRDFGAGHVSVRTGSASVIESGNSGIVAVDEATAIAEAADSTITVIAKGVIHSGSSLNHDETMPGGIIAGYLPGGDQMLDKNVAGDVIVKSAADMTADAGYGILAYTYGTGNVSVTTGHSSSIAVLAEGGIGIGAFAHDGGDVDITNKGMVSAATGVSAAADKDGSIVISNHGEIAGLSADGIDVFDSDERATGAITITNSSDGSIIGAATSVMVHGHADGLVTIDNAGLIGPAIVSSWTSAISEDGGFISIDNTGRINGDINVGDGIFTNESTGIWQVAGASSFGACAAGVVENFGAIDLSGNAVLSGPHGLAIIDSGVVANLTGDNAIDGAWLTITAAGVLSVIGGELTIDSHSIVKNLGTIAVEADSALHVLGSDIGVGAVVIDQDAVAEFGSYVQSGQTVSFINLDGKLVIDNPSLFDAHIAGISDSGDVLDLRGFNAAHDVVRALAGQYNAATNTTKLIVTDETTHHSTKLTLVGDYANTTWTTTSDGHGGADVSWNHQAPVIETDNFTVTHNDDGTTTITGLEVSDADSSASTETFSLSASTGSASSSVSPPSDTGSLADVNAALNSIVYDPSANGAAPKTDQINVTVTDGFGAGETVHFIFNEGGGSNVTLQGTSGNNVLFATEHADTLIGGGQDQFVFKPASGPDVVQHTVVDFNTHTDTIDLRQFGNIGAWTDVTAAQQGADTLLTLDSHDTVLLKNVLAANLHASDFIVTPHIS